MNAGLFQVEYTQPYYYSSKAALQLDYHAQKKVKKSRKIMTRFRECFSCALEQRFFGAATLLLVLFLLSLAYLFR